MIALMDAMGLPIPRFVLQEDYFIEEQHKEEEGKVRLIVRGDRFVSCDDFIDRISITDIKAQWGFRDDEAGETSGHFWHAFDANDLPKSVAMTKIIRPLQSTAKNLQLTKRKHVQDESSPLM